MEGLIASHKRMELGGAPAVVHAAVVAYGFVFLHPFEDGNGRIHRFLIHNILARMAAPGWNPGRGAREAWGRMALELASLETAAIIQISRGLFC